MSHLFPFFSPSSAVPGSAQLHQENLLYRTRVVRPKVCNTFRLAVLFPDPVVIFYISLLKNEKNNNVEQRTVFLSAFQRKKHQKQRERRRNPFGKQPSMVAIIYPSPSDPTIGRPAHLTGRAIERGRRHLLPHNPWMVLGADGRQTGCAAAAAATFSLAPLPPSLLDWTPGRS